MTRFKVGDRVRLKKSVTTSSTYEDTGLFSHEIPMLRGKELVVVEIERDGYRGLLDVMVVAADPGDDDDHSAWLNSDALKPVAPVGRNKFKIGDKVHLKKSVTREDLGKVWLDCEYGQRDLLGPRDAGFQFEVTGLDVSPRNPHENTQLNNRWWVHNKWLKLVEDEPDPLVPMGYNDALNAFFDDPRPVDEIDWEEFLIEQRILITNEMPAEARRAGYDSWLREQNAVTPHFTVRQDGKIEQHLDLGHATVDEVLDGPAHSDGGVWLAPAGTPMPTAADINGPDSPWTKLGEIASDGYEEFQEKINEASAKLAASMEGVTVENFQSGAFTSWDPKTLTAAALGIDSKGDPDVGPNEDSFYPGGKIYADASIGEVAKDEITFTVEQVVALLEAYKKAV